MKLMNLFEARGVDYTLDNYQEMPRFTDVGTDKYKVGDNKMLMNPPPQSRPAAISKIYNKHKPGTIVKILGRVLNESGMHYIVVRPLRYKQVYKIYGYYLQPADQELQAHKPRLKKRLTGTLDCGNCGKTFNLEVPGGKHRDHCPHCLFSVHIDKSPGDRGAWCGESKNPDSTEPIKDEDWIPSKLVPQGTIETLNYNQVQEVTAIVYKCEKCGTIKVNKKAPDDNSSEMMKLHPVELKKKNGRHVIVNADI